MSDNESKSREHLEQNAAGTREELRALLEEFDTAMLVTRDALGMPRGRPMAVLKRSNGDGALWFATHHDAPKVHEIEQQPMVCATFFRPGDGAWVSVSGRAMLTRDRTRIHELWGPGMKAFFEGPDDPTIALIRVEPHHAEYWEPKGGRVRRTFELVKGMVTGATPDMGAVKHVSRAELNRLSEPDRISKS